MNRAALEALVKCGAFGSTGATRKGMLAVLEQAQAGGQKAQQDAQIGQGSIFDLGGDGDTAGTAVLPRPAHPTIDGEEFEQPEMLAAEKEAIGLFISAHPLKPLREAMRAKVDRPISDLEGRPDGEQVLVGGIVSQYRRVKARSGQTIVFAALDDLTGTVELTFFPDRASEEQRAALALDAVVLVRGRLEHREADRPAGRGEEGPRNRTTVVVQSVVPFAPSEEEIERARASARASERAAAAAAETVHLTVSADELSATRIEDLKQTIGDFAGRAEVVIDIRTSVGTRRLRLGDAFRVLNTPALRAELAQALAPRAQAA